MLLLPGAVLPRNQAEVTGDLSGTLPSRKSTDVIEGGHKGRGGDRPDAGTGRQSFDDRVVRDHGLEGGVHARQLLVKDRHDISNRRERLVERRGKL